MVRLGGFNGSVLVARGGTTVLEASAGVADTSTGAECGADTRYQIASVSKQFTAAAVMLLAEEGEIVLDAAVGHWLTDCPAHWRDLTPHQLLTHTSGLGHWPEVPGFDINQPGSAAQILDRLSATPLLSAPGSTWHYSSPGYLLAARIVETVTGQRYADFLTERVLRSLGMASTSVGTPPQGGAVASGYRQGRRVDAVEFAAAAGAGDVWSTVGDLTRFTAAFETGELLTARSRAAMTAPHAPVPDEVRGAAAGSPAIADGYGYGYLVGTLAGHPAHFHPGDNPGYQAFLGRVPGLEMTVAILCNDEETGIDKLLRQLSPLLAAA